MLIIFCWAPTTPDNVITGRQDYYCTPETPSGDSPVNNNSDTTAQASVPARQLSRNRKDSDIPRSPPTTSPHSPLTMLLKLVSCSFRPVPTSYTIRRLSPFQHSRSFHRCPQKVYAGHLRRQLYLSSHPLLLSSTIMSSYDSSSSVSSITSSPAGTNLSSPSSSVSSLPSMRMSTSSKRVSLSARHLGHANTISLGDTSALENSFKMASLDTMRGYAQNHYVAVEQTHDTEYVPRPNARGYQVLREPAWNKGTPSLINVVCVGKPFFFLSLSGCGLLTQVFPRHLV